MRLDGKLAQPTLFIVEGTQIKCVNSEMVPNQIHEELDPNFVVVQSDTITDSSDRQISPVRLRRSSRIRKPSAKAAEMLSNKQISNAATEIAFLAARNENIDVPFTNDEALKTQHANKWIEAYESEMKSLIDHGTFSAPLDNVFDMKSIMTAKIVLGLKKRGGQ